MEIQAKNVAIEVAKGAALAGLGFGAGCLVGKIVKGPALLTGGIFAISTLASHLIGKLTKVLAEKYHWKLSTVKIIEAAAAAVLSVATAVSLFAAGVFGPVGLGVYAGVGIAFSAIPLGMGLYAKYNGKDMPYEEAKAFAHKTLPKDAPDEQVKELEQQQLFYQFAV